MIFPSRIATNLIQDQDGNVLFGLENKHLVKIDRKGKESLVATFSNDLNRLNSVSNNIFLYTYPNLHSLDK